MAIMLFDLPGGTLTDQTGSTPIAAFADLLTDTLYGVVGTAILPFRAGAAMTAIWRSKRFALPRVHGFAWLRLNGTFSAGAVVRLYQDGALFYTTPSITNKNPVRVKLGRSMRWELEVESADRLTSMVVTSTIEEMRQFEG